MKVKLENSFNSILLISPFSRTKHLHTFTHSLNQNPRFEEALHWIWLLQITAKPLTETPERTVHVIKASMWEKPLNSVVQLVVLKREIDNVAASEGDNEFRSKQILVFYTVSMLCFFSLRAFKKQATHLLIYKKYLHASCENIY